MDSAVSLDKAPERTIPPLVDPDVEATATAMSALALIPSPVNEPAAPDPSFSRTMATEIVTGPDLVATTSEPRTFSTLPSKIRLKIYHLLVPEKLVLTIHQLPLNYLHEKLPTTALRDRYIVDISLAMLLVSSQIYSELKPIMDDRPFILAGVSMNAALCPAFYPKKMLSRVDELHVFAGKLDCLDVLQSPIGIHWCYRELLMPHLRTILVESSWVCWEGLRASSDKKNLQYPVDILPELRKWLESECEAHRTSMDINPALAAPAFPVPTSTGSTPAATRFGAQESVPFCDRSKGNYHNSTTTK